jgi:hypothetical protein
LIFETSIINFVFLLSENFKKGESLKKKPFFIVLLAILLTAELSYSQIVFPSMAVAGGPTVGWNFISANDLNLELKKAGFPELSKNGFFTLGGGGFLDLPLEKNFLRIGAMGVGFSTNKETKVTDSLTKAVSYNFGMGGLSGEYVFSFGIFDVSLGALFSTGTLKLDLYQYGKDHGNYNSIFGELSGNTASPDITRNFYVRFYSVQPQAGLGILIKKFVYLRLNAGYLVSAQGNWKVDNDVEVKNFPSGVKSNGFNINLGINFGLFFRD